MRCNRRPTRPAQRPLVTAVVPALIATSLTALTTSGFTAAASGAAPTHGKYAPVAKVERIRQGTAGVYVRGWAYDQDTTAPVPIRIRLDGHRLARVPANLHRPDLVAKHPGIATDIGFHLSTAVPSGQHKICVRVVDLPSRVAAPVACRTLTFAFDPYGAVDGLTKTPGFLTATGWAIDPNDKTSARHVIVRVDGKSVLRTSADLPVDGLADEHPRAGADHGFSATFPITEGTHTICLKATNVGLGTGHVLQCFTRTVNFSPTGAITALGQIPGGLRIHGWARDPDTTATTRVTVTAGGKKLGTTPANLTGKTKSGYNFAASLPFAGTKLAPGTRTICAVAHNLGKYGSDQTVQCMRQRFNWNPSAGVRRLFQHSPGATIRGWATDPDTHDPVSVRFTADGKRVGRTLADGAGGSNPGHMFKTTIPLPDGKHTVCAIAINADFGSGDSAPRCRQVLLAFEPYGKFESVARSTDPDSTDLVATGWAIDPDTKGAVPVQVSVDGGDPVTAKANIDRPDVAAKHPGTGTAHGFVVIVPADDGEHSVCVTAVNVRGGSGTTDLGCKIINAVHPDVPSAPTGVTAIAGYGGARVVWAAPASDGGAPWTAYTVTAAPGGVSVRVEPGIAAATLLGLKPNTKYTFSVVAINVAGNSLAGTSPVVTTEKEPPAQTSPAPISTSRYIRNIYGGSAADLRKLTREGAADATANPSGHGYLAVLAVGGQDESRHGVVLSATIRFVSYANMVKNLQAYVDGYASQQRPSAPVTLAIATNNDIDVSSTSGQHFADNVIDPVRRYAAKYPGITIAGSNDMEPGFRASYAQSSAWLDGYLHATPAPFVFTGSADGCAWSRTGGGCNNGWTMRGMYRLAGGAAPIRIINLPQIYNTTMAQQWRYISLTGVQIDRPRINFGGALTEWTACQQAGSCGSLTGNSAWRIMWKQLSAEPKLKPTSLPYSTDLRIDS